ncbi:DegT/DnrJ/EryC1/StrS family aminotransferase [Prochlorococcus marinus]|uniref:DegT/DnrJ/EryC1/StrS family aminotransferase n=1 Tax=Prochlorococcus marinus TaxID=1219 RepID=UPI0022B5BEB7|nr:DegT/DnrJ/EryC1/StrS family aminotransferase [Prochlorococcus marinus]
MFKVVEDFEKAIADFYNAPYAIATDSCTHSIELCLRLKQVKNITIPNRTYLSIAFLPAKLNLKWSWDNAEWLNYYYLGNTNIIDAAVYWKKGGYIENTFMCLSFQFQKHLSLGRGGMILCDNPESHRSLKKMSYDGRSPGIPWREQKIDTIGYHYYMTPETASLGLNKLNEAKQKHPRQWAWEEWPDLSKLEVFN